MNVSNVILIPAALLFVTATVCLPARGQEKSAASPWPADKANDWYAKQPWLVGSNYITSSAINQLEMWQGDTFDLASIDRELGWAEGLGFNTMRVFLHHLLWQQDKAGFLNRIDQFLEVAHKHHIRIMFVLFDSVWDPEPKLGKQREPRQGLHNSGWVQSPGKADLLDPKRHQLLEDYVKGVVGAYKNDPRIAVWDIWNEPDNLNGSSYGETGTLKTELPKDVKHKAVLELLPKAFAWARAAGATQPLTSGLWLGGHKADPTKLIPIEKAQLENSDVISFHSYDPRPGTEKWVANLKAYKRPILCTEYMARPQGSTFDPMLAWFKQEKIAAYNWGFVAGKSNTIYPWDSWQHPYATEPKVWFHDIFRIDGTPYREEEVKYIRSVTGKK
jgi:hypothetical protein